MKHLKILLPEEKRKNLKKLADYLLKGELKAKFNMSRYTGHKIFTDEDMYATDCGTIGCAVGHGPFAGVLKNEKELWDEYSERCFIDDTRNSAYGFLFAGEWEDVDNTPQGAAKRILYFLENGIPENWEEQIEGFEPICY